MELLIVIVVIAILASISVVAYNGIQDRAEETKLQSDLRQAANLVTMDYALDGAYPANESAVNEGQGFSPSDGTRLQYSANSDSYCLTATSTRRNVRAFYISSDTGSIHEGPCDGHEWPSAGDGNEDDDVAATPGSCFAFAASTGTITDYYNNEGNNGTNDACPRDVVIPEQIGGIAVSSIGTYAFGDKRITSVTIPDSVASIDVDAFYGNQLTSVIIPDSVISIGSVAFSDNQLTSVTIPDSVMTIGDFAFAGNPLTTVSVKTGTALGDEAFPSSTTVIWR